MLVKPIWTVINSECVAAMEKMQPESIDAVVCDPPYDLLSGSRGGSGRSNESDVFGRHGAMNRGGFMGLKWDATGVAFDPDTWRAVLRLLKPGGHMLVMGGTRTYHRVTCAIEDAGFEIRDCMMFMYGSGFPKGLNIAKAIDKAARGVPQGGSDPTSLNHGNFKTQSTEGKRSETDYGRGFGAGPGQFMATIERYSEVRELVPEAQVWAGWNVALKPAYEPIVVARKPIDRRSVTSNVLAHGTGAINIDASRIGVSKDVPASPSRGQNGTSLAGSVDGSLRLETGKEDGHNPNVGRWPANILLAHSEDCVLVGSRLVKGDPRDTGNGVRPSGFVDTGAENGSGEPNAPVYGDSEVGVYECVEGCPIRLLDEQAGVKKSGTGAVKKASGNGYIPSAFGKENRAVGTPNVEYGDSGSVSRFFYTSKVSKKERGWGLDEPHTHPTAKPVDLMQYLVRMITPPGGCVLDPFMGSGTTLIAAMLEGFDSVGIDAEKEYAEVAQRRVEFWAANGPPK
jgi:DNA modification methylase